MFGLSNITYYINKIIFLSKFSYETSINIKFLCAFQNLRQMTKLIKTHSIIVEFYYSKNFGILPFIKG